MRARRLIAGLAFVAVLGSAASAAAQDEGTTTTTVVATPEGAVPIGDGYAFTGATVMSPDGTTREMTAYQAAVFVQSWLAQAIFGSEEMLRDPPPELPVHRIDVGGVWGSGPAGRVTVYFATDGDTAYIAFPQDQGVATDPSTPVPEPSEWFVPLPRVIETFNGRGKLIETTGTQQATSTTTEGSGSGDGSSEGDTEGWPWIAVGAAVALLVVGGLVLRSRRAR